MKTKLSISDDSLLELKALHQSSKCARIADKLKAIMLIAQGFPRKLVATALFLDEETISSYVEQYNNGSIEDLLRDEYKGSSRKLSKNQISELDEHLRNHTYLKVVEIVEYVKNTYDIVYTVSGMTDLLHDMKFVYKKPKIVPGKANMAEQEAFVELYRNLKDSKDDRTKIFFMDGTHPQHNPIASYGWIKKGEDKEIKSNTGRRRLNINGAVCIETLDVISVFDESVNAQSTIKLFKKILHKNPNAEKIHVICDNARYYRSKMVNEFLENSKIELVFLPPYAPNLNVIERLWRYFKKEIVYNKYYGTFDLFQETCKDFFKNIGKHKNALSTLLTDKFKLQGA